MLGIVVVTGVEEPVVVEAVGGGVLESIVAVEVVVDTA
jgi:hypothetical protein